MFDSLKDEVQSLRSENQELKRSLEYTQAQLEDITKQTQEQSKLLANSPKHDKSVNSLSDRLRLLEDYSRKNNLVVEGYKEDEHDDRDFLRESMCRFLPDKLQITPGIEEIHRIGTAKGTVLQACHH